MTLRPLPHKALGVVLGIEQRITRGGIIIASDDGKDRGIRPRWIYLYGVGSEIDYIKEGQYVYVEHGRWSRAVEYEGIKLVNIDLDAILAVSDEEPDDDAFGLTINTAPDSHTAEDFGAN
jgi:hypothetical protein